MSAKANAPAAGQPAWLAELLNDRLRLVSLILTVIGFVNAGYLAWTKFTSTSIYCGPGSSACDAASNSRFGYIFDIPVSYPGFATYVILLLLLVLETRHPLLKNYGPVAVFGLTLFGTLFSGYLQYASIFVLHEICPYCVVNALTLLVLCLLAVFRLRRSLAGSDE